MNVIRRAQVIAGVVGTTAAAGAAAGVVIAGVALMLRPSHIHPALVWEWVKLGSQAGASFGIMLGTPLTLVMLRRVPLWRLASTAFASATYGGIMGLALSLPFAQPRPTVSFIIAGSCAGFAFAATRLWFRFRRARGAVPVQT